MNSEKYIGLDVHQATIVVAVTDSTGKLVMESSGDGSRYDSPVLCRLARKFGGDLPFLDIH
jgi:hypothetical protein